VSCSSPATPAALTRSSRSNAPNRTGGDADMIESLHGVKSIGLASLDALQQGDTAAFGCT
jgi:hypothetical protein